MSVSFTAGAQRGGKSSGPCGENPSCYNGGTNASITRSLSMNTETFQLTTLAGSVQGCSRHLFT